MVEIIQDKLDNQYVYAISLGFYEPHADIKFTLLNWREYKALSDILQCGVNPINIEEIVWEKCVLDSQLTSPDVWEKLNAGIVSTVASLILYLSGSQSIPDLNLKLAQQRVQAADVQEQIPMYIASVFPSYKLEDFDNMPFPQILLRFAQAEQILLERGVLEQPVQWLTPEEAEAEAKKQPAPYTDPDTLKEKALNVNHPHHGKKPMTMSRGPA